MPTLTLEQARTGGLHSVQARRNNKAELLRLRLRVAELESALPVKPTYEPKESVNDELVRTRKQIEALNDLLDDCTDAKEQDALTRAKERLFRIWAHLAQLPGPGNLKPSAARPQARRMPEPIPVAQPLHVMPDSSQAVEPKQ